MAFSLQLQAHTAKQDSKHMYSYPQLGITTNDVAAYLAVQPDFPVTVSAWYVVCLTVSTRQTVIEYCQVEQQPCPFKWHT